MLKQSLQWVFAVVFVFLGTSGWAFENNPMQGAHQDIQSMMEVEEPNFLPQLEVLWRHTLSRSPTLQLALTKMAEKTGKLKEKDKKLWTTQMLQGLVQLGGMGGAIAAGSPLPLIGSVALSRGIAPEEAPKRLSAVTSADLVLLTREIEEAQSQLIYHYVQYRYALERQKKLEDDVKAFDAMTKTIVQDSPEITDTVHTLRMARVQAVQQAGHTVETYRNLLVLSAGEAAMDEIDQMALQPAPAAASSRHQPSQ